MAVLQFKVLSGDPIQNLSAWLNGELYSVRLVYNSRSETWTMSLYSGDSTALIEGYKLTPDWKPMRNILVANLPDGSFSVME